MPAETEPIPLSAVQHAVYCLRQAALIHLERLWAENRFTAEGDVLHAVADKGGSRKGRGVRRVLSLPLVSARLNLTGIADLVEFQGDVPFPVEYKRGKPKLHRADEVQLCAGAVSGRDDRSARRHGRAVLCPDKAQGQRAVRPRPARVDRGHDRRSCRSAGQPPDPAAYPAP